MKYKYDDPYFLSPKEKDECMETFKQEFTQIATKIIPLPSENSSLYERSIYFFRTHLVTELKPDKLPDELLDNWFVKDLDAYTDFIIREDADPSDPFTLPFRVFCAIYGMHDEFYAIYFDDDQYSTASSTLSIDFFRYQYVLRIVREARRQGMKLPEVNIFDFYHYDELMPKLEPQAERLGIDPELIGDMREMKSDTPLPEDLPN